MKSLLLSAKKLWACILKLNIMCPEKNSLYEVFSPILVFLPDSDPELKRFLTFSRKLCGRFVKTALKEEEHFDEKGFSFEEQSSSPFRHPRHGNF